LLKFSQSMQAIIRCKEKLRTFLLRLQLLIKSIIVDLGVVILIGVESCLASLVRPLSIASSTNVCSSIKLKLLIVRTQFNSFCRLWSYQLTLQTTFAVVFVLGLIHNQEGLARETFLCLGNISSLTNYVKEFGIRLD